MMYRIYKRFQEVYGAEGDITVYFAPGRVNLIGEHTDYNGVHVFPCALTIGTYGAVRKRNDNKLRFYSMNFGHLPVIESSLDDLKPRRNAGWTNYPKGVMWALREKGYELPCGIDLMLFGNIPNGSGLSSSASVEILTGYILNDLFQLGISNQDLALLGQFSENHFNGVNCGIMDQFASVFGKEGHLIRLDCRSLEYQYFPFKPDGYRLVLVDSVVKHELASSAYNKRRQSCENVVAAVQKIHPHVEYLRDCNMEMLNEVKAQISEEDYMRAEYVIEEIQRVLDVCDALERGDYETVGQKMYETHHGMSKLYEVSCEELDYLNDIAFDCGVTGSRVMGGGFGGCTINLVKNELYETFIITAKERFKEKFGRSPKVYDVVISDGSHKVC